MLNLERDLLHQALELCCGSHRWIEAMEKALPSRRGGTDEAALLAESERAFACLDERDWLEVFAHHPKIGDLDSLRSRFAQTADLASNEQSGARATSRRTLEQLRAANLEYKRRFGYIFIVCATGKSALEMLQLLRGRLGNDAETELREAAAEQRKITRLRLEALFGPSQKSAASDGSLD